MDSVDLSLTNAGILEELATLLWIRSDNKELAEKLACTRIAYELYQRLSGERELETMRQQAILGIAAYIKKHPKASKEELAAEIGKQIQLFAQKVDAL